MKKLALFLVDYFDNGQVKYAAGSDYEVNDEIERAVAAGHAEFVKESKKAKKETAVSVETVGSDEQSETSTATDQQ